jgi:hypothetical protein
MHRSNVMAEVADEFRGETRQREIPMPVLTARHLLIFMPS